VASSATPIGSPAASAPGLAGLRVLVPPSDTPVAIQVSEDGDLWTTIQIVEPAEAWRGVVIDTGGFNGRVLFVRVVK
jgi:hypothetical protein